MRGSIIILGMISLLSYPHPAQTRRSKKAPDKDAFIEHVTKLRQVDRIVIVATGGPRKVLPSLEGSPIVDDGLPDHLSKLASVELKGEKAEELARLWRGLRNGNGAGCFAPAYLLDFYAGSERILRSEVCFHCCNITIPSSGIRSICGDEKALELFKKFVTDTLPYPKAGSANNPLLSAPGANKALQLTAR